MYCPKCGARNEDGVRYCQQCGAQLAAGAPAAAPAQAPVYGGAAYMIKTMGRGALYLTATIAYTCAILFALIGSMNTGSVLNSVFYQLMDMPELRYGMDSSAWQAIQILQSLGGGMSVGGALLGQLPAIVIATGLWLLFVSALDRSGAPLNTVGLTVIKVAVIVQTVLYSLGALLVVLLMVLVTSAAAGSLSSSESYVTGVLVVIILVILAVAALMLFYYIKLIQTIGGISSTVQTNSFVGSVSMYVVVCCFIMGGAAGISALGSLLNPLGALGSIGTATACICFGILLLNYRKAIQAAAYGVPAQPPRVQAPAPQPAPQPAVQQPMPPVPPVQPAPAAPQPPVQQQPVLPTFPSAPVMPMAPMMDTVVMQETSLLDETGPFLPPARLVHLRTNTVTNIDHQPFRIGKEADAVDLCITDNTAVSRHHADILYHDGAFYVVDLNSTNHVYLNDQQIPANTQMPLSSGVVLRLADELFRFELV